MKTSELTGAALDWAVATAEGYSEWDGECFTSYADGYPGAFYLSDWKPSSKWQDGGIIIERERLCISTGSAESVYMSWIYDGLEMTWITHAETPLIAAMRCYVASKLGDEVDIPQQLTQQQEAIK